MITVELYQSFPRLHTAIAEWVACLIFILPRTKRQKSRLWLVVACLFFFPLLITNLVSEKQDGIFWVGLMILCMAEMILMILCCCEAGIWKALYYWAHAFIAAEFAASLEWQICCYLIAGGTPLNEVQQLLIMTGVYLVAFGILWMMNSHNQLLKNQPHISRREAISATVITLSMFLLSNVAFTFRDSVVSQSLGAGVLFVRTLADFSGLVMLYAHDEMRREIRLRFELEAMDNLFQRQYDQYRQAEENSKVLHCIYHDLKHQIDFIKEESDEQKKAAYLSEMEHAISIYDAEVNTGNSVLDTLLTSKNLVCKENGITMTCFAEADKLEYIDVMDICSLFGNAIDNAIEYEMKVEDRDKRLIKVTVYPQNQFLLIRIENYCEEVIPLRDDLPRTSKRDARLHGYGVKSILRVAEKYGGNVNISQADNWFSLTVLIPLEADG